MELKKSESDLPPSRKKIPNNPEQGTMRVNQQHLIIWAINETWMSHEWAMDEQWMSHKWAMNEPWLSHDGTFEFGSDTISDLHVFIVYLLLESSKFSFICAIFYWRFEDTTDLIYFN